LSAEAEAVARRLFESFNRGAEPEDVWTDDAVYSEDQRWPGAGVYRGRDEIVRCWIAYAEIFDEPLFTLTSAEAHDDRVLATALFRGRVGEMPVEHEWGYVVVVRGGLVQSLTAYFDPEDARAAFAGP
jgi:ketosteroid isomerase-like protein